MKEVKIKKANLDDANRILEIQKKAFQVKGKIYDDFSLPALEETLEELKEEFKQKTIFKIVSATGEILGSGRTYIEDDTCYISRLSVTPKY